MLPSVIDGPAGCLGFTRSPSSGAVAQAPTNHLFFIGFNRSSCARADLSNGRMRTPGQGRLAIGSSPLIQQRVQVKTGAFASNVLQSCVSCRLILKSFSPPLPSVHRRAGRVLGVHSMTSSARADSWGGTSMPSVIAVFRLMNSSTLVTCWTGRSAGFSPLRIRPV
jgi:hypothetical protein